MAERKSLRSIVKGIANQSGLFMGDMLHADRRTNALLRVKHDASWYFLRNPQSQKHFIKHRPTLTRVQQELVESLYIKGIAARSFDQAGIDSGDWNQLQQKVTEFARLSAEKINAATVPSSDKLVKSDDYTLKMNPENPVLPSDHPLLRIGLSAPVLHTVASYLNLWPKLIYTDASYSLPLDSGKRMGPAQWHRDPEDRQMVKVYLYFSEIDETADAMEYILGSSNLLGGDSTKIGEWKAAGADLYPTAELVEKSFPAARHFSCAGPVGTLLFCDTTGLHRGGICRSQPRVVATWTFVTPASRHERQFTVRSADGHILSDEAKLVLNH